MEQQLQKLTQAILAQGKLLKQLEVQCAAIQASVEEMKPKPVTPPAQASSSIPPAQASSSRSLATGELDAPMLTGSLMNCPNDDTDSRTSAFMPDVAPGPPSTAALLDVAITSPEPTDATIMVRDGTDELTPTPSSTAVHPVDLGDEHVPNLSNCQLGAYKVFDRMCDTDGISYGFSTNGLVLTTCCPDKSSTAGIAVVDRATRRRERAHRVLTLARLENSCGAMEFRPPWPPPTQVDVACRGVELCPISWLSCEDYRGGVKWMPPWSPPVPGRMLILEKRFCPVINSIEVMCSFLSFDHLRMVSEGYQSWKIVGGGSQPKASISHDQPVLCSAWKDDGATVFSGDCDKQVKIWPMLSGGQAQTVAIEFLVGSIEGRVGVHHIDDSQQSKNFTFKCHREANDIFSINSLNFHPVHHMFATVGSDGVFNFWDKDSKQRLKAFSRCPLPIPCNTFNSEGYQMVGFEVVPCSVKHNAEDFSKLNMYDSIELVSCPVELQKSQVVRQQERITFTYDVEFVKSNIRWPSRWDAYLKMEAGARVRWFSIMNSLMVILFWAAIVFVIFLRTVRGDLTRYKELDKEAQAQMNEELSGLKLIVGDVFRKPTCPKLLCIMIGDGVQILGMAIVTIVFSTLGFMSPASRAIHGNPTGQVLAKENQYDIVKFCKNEGLILRALDFTDAHACLEKVSYSLWMFFCGMLITVDGFNKTGIPSTLWELVEPHARIDSAKGIALLAVVILVLSNVASNVPTVLLLGTRVAASAAAISPASEKKAWLILAWVSTAAGNLTLLGSAANLIVCEQARRAQLLIRTMMGRLITASLKLTQQKHGGDCVSA